MSGAAVLPAADRPHRYAIKQQVWDSADTPSPRSSELVQVVTERGQLDLEILALPDAQDEILHLARRHDVPGHHVPVVEYALREGLPARLLAQGGDEAEGLGDREVRLHLNKWRALT